MFADRYGGQIMTHFQKLLKLQKKVDSHAWKHTGFGDPKPEAIDLYVREGIDRRIKKLVRKGTGQLTFACR